MRKILFFISFLFVALSAIEKIKVPIRDTSNRDTLKIEDIRIYDNDNFYTVKYTGSKPRIDGEKLTGKFIILDHNSSTIDMELQDGLAVGDWQYYGHTFQGPIINSEVSFVEGYKNGTETVYSHKWNNSTDLFENYIYRITKYVMGKKTYEISYWDNKQVISEMIFDKNGKEDGDYIYYNGDGSINTRGKYKNGKEVGVWDYFGYDGNLVKQVTHKGNLSHKVYFFPDGSISEKRSTRGLIYEGDYFRYDINGKILEHHFYKNGIEQGSQIKTYREDYHSPYATAYYRTNKKGIIQGEYLELYLKSGKVKVTGRYDKKGNPDGTWSYYTEEGVLYRTENFKDGILKSSYNKWIESPFIEYDKIPEKPVKGQIPQKAEEIPFFLFSE